VAVSTAAEAAVAFMGVARFAGAVGSAADQWAEVVSAAVREDSVAPTVEQEDLGRAGTEALRAVLMAAGARTAARTEAPAQTPSDREALAGLRAGLAPAVRARLTQSRMETGIHLAAIAGA
jgi:hypothetical protein